MPKQRPAGFTLLETIVTFAVIAVLASLMLTVFMRTREGAHNATCQSNLGQIARAMQQYVRDNNGMYPAYIVVENPNTAQAHALKWNDLLVPYLKKTAVLLCPSHDNNYGSRSDSDYEYNRFQLNVVERPTPSLKPPFSVFRGIRAARVASPTRTIMNFEASWHTMDGSNSYGEPIQGSCPRNRWAINLHSSGGNFSYADGHVKWLSIQQQGVLDCARYNQRKD